MKKKRNFIFISLSKWLKWDLKTSQLTLKFIFSYQYPSYTTSFTSVSFGMLKYKKAETSKKILSIRSIKMAKDLEIPPGKT